MGDYEWAVMLLIFLGVAGWEWLGIRRELRRMRAAREAQPRAMRNGSSARTHADENRSSDRLS